MAMVKKNLNININDTDFLRQELLEAQRMLFAETNIKKIKFLQNKIKYLRDLLAKE